MIISNYVRCPQCRKLVPEHGLSRYDKPCPQCGSSGEARISWPSLSVSYLLYSMNELNMQNPNNHNIAVVLICIIFELLLEQILSETMQIRNVDLQVAEYIFKNSQGNQNRLKAIKDISGYSIKKSFSELGFNDFWATYNNLLKQRNKFVHEGIPVDSNCADMIKSIKEQLFVAFQLLNNKLIE